MSYWGEGESISTRPREGDGGPAQPDDATWIHTFFDSMFWANPGGDFSSTPSASTSVGGNGRYAWSSTQMAADLQDWLDNPETNFGWALIGDESSPTTAKRFDSKDHPIESVRPILIIEFEAPAGGTPTPLPTPTAAATDTPTNTSTPAPTDTVSPSQTPDLTPEPVDPEDFDFVIDDMIDAKDLLALLMRIKEGNDAFPDDLLGFSQVWMVVFAGGN